MTTYKDIHGSSIQNVDGDPANTKAGQFWYDSVNSEFKYQDQFIGSAWSTGGDLNQVKNGLGGGGTQTAGIAFAGFIPPNTANTELYNGSAWTEVNNLNTARNGVMGCGSQTAAICTGANPGPTNALNELWNGTNWTEVNDINTGRAIMGSGTATSALGFGGENGDTDNIDNTESWNGTNWRSDR